DQEEIPPYPFIPPHESDVRNILRPPSLPASSGRPALFSWQRAAMDKITHVDKEGWCTRCKKRNKAVKGCRLCAVKRGESTDSPTGAAAAAVWVGVSTGGGDDTDTSSPRLSRRRPLPLPPPPPPPSAPAGPSAAMAAMLALSDDFARLRADILFHGHSVRSCVRRGNWEGAIENADALEHTLALRGFGGDRQLTDGAHAVWCDAAVFTAHKEDLEVVHEPSRMLGMTFLLRLEREAPHMLAMSRTVQAQRRAFSFFRQHGCDAEGPALDALRIVRRWQDSFETLLRQPAEEQWRRVAGGRSVAAAAIPASTAVTAAAATASTAAAVAAAAAQAQA
ncbi:unnamed protein product, partial [Phaeothamnion confervicola]